MYFNKKDHTYLNTLNVLKLILLQFKDMYTHYIFNLEKTKFMFYLRTEFRTRQHTSTDIFNFSGLCEKVLIPKFTPISSWECIEGIHGKI